MSVLLQKVFQKLLRVGVVAASEPEDSLFSQLDGRVTPGDVYHLLDGALVARPAQGEDDLLFGFFVFLVSTLNQEIN